MKHGDVRSYLDRETKSKKISAFWASRDEIWMYCYNTGSGENIRRLNDDDFCAKFILASEAVFPIDAWEESAQQSDKKDK